MFINREQVKYILVQPHMAHTKGQQPFSVQGKIVSILGFSGQIVSVADYSALPL